MRRNKYQRAAVSAVRSAAKRLIAEIDRDKNSEFTEYRAMFHLDRNRTALSETEYWMKDGVMFPIKIGNTLFQCTYSEVD